MKRHIIALAIALSVSTSASAKSVTAKEGESARPCNEGWVRTKVITPDQAEKLVGQRCKKESEQAVHYLCVGESRFKVTCEDGKDE